MLMLLVIVCLRNFGQNYLETVLIVNSNKAEVQALGAQNQELWTQNGLLREQNKTLKAMVVAVEDLAYLLKVVQDAQPKPAPTPGPDGPA
jgi:hypothetical protein